MRLEHEHLTEPPSCAACGHQIEGYHPHKWVGDTRLYYHPTRYCNRHRKRWQACWDQVAEMIREATTRQAKLL